MKCPKCGYLGFESVDRCRNCGYEFSLTPEAALPELPMRSDSTARGSLDDLVLIDGAAQRESPADRVSLGLERAGAPRLYEEVSSPRAQKNELPLLPRAEDEPLITRPSPPRPPLAVRRATPEMPRLRGSSGAGIPDQFPQPRIQSLDLGVEDEAPAAREFSDAGSTSRLERVENAAVGQRLVAVALDLLILSAIDAIVIYFTLQICGVPVADVAILPKGPLLAFLLVQNGGYLVAFTAGGQTLGKMATGIRVVATDSSDTLDLRRALMRTLAWVLLAVPAGLGFLTLFNRDHRGLHDRFAGTRVVRASA